MTRERPRATIAYLVNDNVLIACGCDQSLTSDKCSDSCEYRSARDPRAIWVTFLDASSDVCLNGHAGAYHQVCIS